MSQVVYNNINLPYPYTTEFSQDPVYEAETDHYLDKYDIQVQCTFNYEYLVSMTSQFSNTPANGDAAILMKLLRTELLRPRRQLQFIVNGTNLIPSAQSGNSGVVDAKNGPQPMSCSITQLTAETFLIVYRIVAHYWESYETGSSNRTTNQRGNAVITNRWTETVEIDNCMYSRRSRRGKYIIRSDNYQGLVADQLREKMAVIGCPRGFLRVSSSYTITPDGLGIQYQVVDQEVYKMPPKPAYEAKGMFILNGIGAGAAITIGQVRLRLRGAKDNKISPQNRLVEAAVAICGQKLSINGATQLTRVSVATDMYDNVVEVSMSARCNAFKGRVGGASLSKQFTKAVCFTPGSEDSQSSQPTYFSRGTASLIVQAARYYDPSLLAAQIGPGDVADPNDNVIVNPLNSNMNTGLSPGRAGRVSEV